MLVVLPPTRPRNFTTAIERPHVRAIWIYEKAVTSRNRSICQQVGHNAQNGPVKVPTGAKKVQQAHKCEQLKYTNQRTKNNSETPRGLLVFFWPFFSLLLFWCFPWLLRPLALRRRPVSIIEEKRAPGCPQLRPTSSFWRIRRTCVLSKKIE